MEADKGHRESLTPSMGLIPLPRSTQTCANKKTRAGPSGFIELAKAYPEAREQMLPYPEQDSRGQNYSYRMLQEHIGVDASPCKLY